MSINNGIHVKCLEWRVTLTGVLPLLAAVITVVIVVTSVIIIESSSPLQVLVGSCHIHSPL